MVCPIEKVTLGVSVRQVSYDSVCHGVMAQYLLWSVPLPSPGFWVGVSQPKHHPHHAPRIRLLLARREGGIFDNHGVVWLDLHYFIMVF